MSDKPPEKIEQQKYQPGEGIRSMRSTGVFRAVNFELYAKPVSDYEIKLEVGGNTLDVTSFDHFF